MSVSHDGPSHRRASLHSSTMASSGPLSAPIVGAGGKGGAPLTPAAAAAVAFKNKQVCFWLFIFSSFHAILNLLIYCFSGRLPLFINYNLLTFVFSFAHSIDFLCAKFVDIEITSSVSCDFSLNLWKFCVSYIRCDLFSEFYEIFYDYLFGIHIFQYYLQILILM